MDEKEVFEKSARIVRSRFVRAEQEFEEAKKALAKLEAECFFQTKGQHDLKVEYNPIRSKKTDNIDRWKGTCQLCGKVTYTGKSTQKTGQREPVFD